MSQRELTAAMQAELAGAYLTPIIFVEVEFETGFVRLWTGYGEISWDGKTWLGAMDASGNLIGTISPLQETTAVQANGVTLTLGGIPPELRGQALEEARQGKQANIWFGLMDSGRQIIADPTKVLTAAVDVPSLEENGQTSIIQITLENPYVDLHRPRERRLTDQEQQKRFPGDLGLQYVPSVQLWNGRWGQATPGIGSGSGTGGGGFGTSGGVGGGRGGGAARPVLE